MVVTIVYNEQFSENYVPETNGMESSIEKTEKTPKGTYIDRYNY